MSDNPWLASGFGRVTREVVSRLCRHPGMQLVVKGWGACERAGNPHQWPFRVFPSVPEYYGQASFGDVIRQFAPDVVITLGEVRSIHWIRMHEARPTFKWIGYIPLDSGPFYPPWQPIFADMDGIVAMSRFGRRVIELGVPSKPVQVSYHGVDTTVFRPLPDRSLLRNHERFRGKFIVGCVARNQMRKNLPSLIKAFSLLARCFKDIHLYLHCTASDEGHDLVTLFKRYGLQGRADLSRPDLTIEQPLPDVALNQLYNLFDISVLPTMGEGFGLPIIESLAAGTPVVATNCSACTELIHGHGELARVLTTLTLGPSVLDQAVVDVDDLARCIEKLYLNPQLRSDYGVSGRRFAQTLTWDAVIPSWLEIVSHVSGVDITETSSTRL